MARSCTEHLSGASVPSFEELHRRREGVLWAEVRTRLSFSFELSDDDPVDHVTRVATVGPTEYALRRFELLGRSLRSGSFRMDSHSSPNRSTTSERHGALEVMIVAEHSASGTDVLRECGETRDASASRVLLLATDKLPQNISGADGVILTSDPVRSAPDLLGLFAALSAPVTLMCLEHEDVRSFFEDGAATLVNVCFSRTTGELWLDAQAEKVIADSYFCMSFLNGLEALRPTEGKKVGDALYSRMSRVMGKPFVYSTSGFLADTWRETNIVVLPVLAWTWSLRSGKET